MPGKHSKQPQPKKKPYDDLVNSRTWRTPECHKVFGWKKNKVCRRPKGHGGAHQE